MYVARDFSLAVLHLHDNNIHTAPRKTGARDSQLAINGGVSSVLNSPYETARISLAVDRTCPVKCAKFIGTLSPPLPSRI